MTTDLISDRRKALLAYKQRLIGEIQLTDKKIEEVRLCRRQASFIEDESSDSENETNLRFGSNLKQLREEQQMLRICLHATQELTGLQILQSEVNVMITAPEISEEPGVGTEGVWWEVTAECVVDRMPFIISFYAHQPNCTFTPTWYRGLKVTLLKLGHKAELDKSILSVLTRPGDAIEVLKSYAAAAWSRRSTLAKLADKFEDSLFMEADTTGGFSLRCADLLHIRWSLQNERSPLAPFQHKFQCDLEHMDPSYIKIIKQAYKQLSYDVGTDDRTLLLAKIVTTCLEAQDPTKQLYESMSSDPDVAREIRRRRTTLDEQPAPAKKRRASVDVMAPPKSPPKKIKGNKENLPDYRKSLKRPFSEKDARNAKKAKSIEEMDKNVESGKSKESTSKVTKNNTDKQRSEATEKVNKEDIVDNRKSVKRPLIENVAKTIKPTESDKSKEKGPKAVGNDDVNKQRSEVKDKERKNTMKQKRSSDEKANKENDTESDVNKKQNTVSASITSHKSSNKYADVEEPHKDKHKTKRVDDDISNTISKNKECVSLESQAKEIKQAASNVQKAVLPKEHKSDLDNQNQNLHKKKSPIQIISSSEDNIKLTSEKNKPDQNKPVKTSKNNTEATNKDVKSQGIKPVFESKYKYVKHISEKTKSDKVKPVEASDLTDKTNSKKITKTTFVKYANNDRVTKTQVAKQTLSKESETHDPILDAKISLVDQKLTEKVVSEESSKSSAQEKDKANEKKKDPNIVDKKTDKDTAQGKKTYKVSGKDKLMEKQIDTEVSTGKNRKSELKSKEKAADTGKITDKDTISYEKDVREAKMASEKRKDPKIVDKKTNKEAVEAKRNDKVSDKENLMENKIDTHVSDNRKSELKSKEKAADTGRVMNKDVFSFGKETLSRKSTVTRKHQLVNTDKPKSKNIAPEETSKRTDGEKLKSKVQHDSDKPKVISKASSEKTMPNTNTEKQVNNPSRPVAAPHKAQSETNLQKPKTREVITELPNQKSTGEKVKYFASAHSDTNLQKNRDRVKTRIPMIGNVKPAHVTSVNRILKSGNTKPGNTTTDKGSKIPQKKWSAFRAPDAAPRMSPRTSTHMRTSSANLGQRLIHKPLKSSPRLHKKLAPPAPPASHTSRFPR